MIHSPRGTREPPSPSGGEPDPPAAGLTDARLIELSRSEPELFAELYDRHAPSIHRYVRRRLGEQAAEDVVADTFLAAFRRRDGYDTGRPNARPWLYGIAANLIGRHRRSETRMLRALARTGVDPVGDTATERVDERVSASSSARRLAGALAGLSARDRETLLLAAWEDLTYEQIGEALSVPVGTVRSRLNRARRKVREALGGTDPTGIEEATG
ncbi:RNA polymerase sigma factor [Actinomadura algeriensis]|uniref:RNA polymerase sigma-70 factor (ECF subfamily) n=1 Tax=Actinomadura algeriensis TaxID=1679523 RepID=A0ABR9JUK3_9ACTN|nr:RNA polymerase sigma factor [Actinomadura algeriensis]MBE1534248.1 RNA polymerase sigma-70 factor (ECF subfamily) [Actinomadura algeriensis]